MDGIHGRLMTNWKPELAESKCAIRCSEEMNVSTVTASENPRMALTFSRLKNSTAIPPSAGRKVTSVRMLVLISSPMSPQKPRNDENAAEENPCRIRSHVSDLHSTQSTGGSTHDRSDAVHRTVDHGAVDESPEEGSRRHNDRDDQDGLVDFIDVVLVGQNGIERARRCRHA